MEKLEKTDRDINHKQPKVFYNRNRDIIKDIVDKLRTWKKNIG